MGQESPGEGEERCLLCTLSVEVKACTNRQKEVQSRLLQCEGCWGIRPTLRILCKRKTP